MKRRISPDGIIIHVSMLLHVFLSNEKDEKYSIT